MWEAAIWTAIIAPLTTLGGTVAGFWFSGRQDEKRDDRAAVREASARRAAFAERRDQERHDIQQQALTALLVKTVELVRLAVEIARHDLDSVLKALDPSASRIPDELDTAFMEEVREIQLHRVSILDQGLRDELQELIAVCVGHPATPRWPFDKAIAQFEQRTAQLNATLAPLFERIGEHHRAEMEWSGSNLGGGVPGARTVTQHG